MISYNKLFIFFWFSFLFWVFINNLFLNYKISILVLLFFVILFFNYYIYIKKFFCFLLIVSLWCLIWILISSSNLSSINNKEIFLQSYYSKNNKFDVIFDVESVYKKNDYDIEYVAKLVSINWGVLKEKIKSVIIVPKNYNIEKWYVIKSRVKLYEYKNNENFEYKEYMLTKNIFFKSYVNVFDIIEIRKWNKIIEIISKIRNFFLVTIKDIYPLDEWIFLQWILIWARENLSDELKTNFNNSWLTHFIAVSWFNITILIIFISLIVKYLPNFLKIIIVSIFIIFFTILVWFGAPVVRASIMWLIWYYIIISGRKWNALSIILLTAIIMVMISPYSLNYDISFHLSFLAIIWIIYTGDLFKKLFYFLPNFLSIREAFILTLSALSFTLPIMIFNFGQLSLLSPLANIAVAWTIPIAMLLWFISVFVYIIFPMLWIWVWYLTWVLLKFDILMVNFFWWLEFAIIRVDFWIYKNYLTLLYFVIMVFLILYFKIPNIKEKTQSNE